MSKARIILADDHELVRHGLAMLIAAQPDLELVGEAEDGLEALKLTRDLLPDLVVMDISMPICDGLTATRQIHQLLPAARILILTVEDEDAALFEAVKAGARGYLLKSTSSAGFLQAVRAVLADEVVLPPRLALSLLDEFARLASGPVSGPSEPLTTREHDVLRLLAAGLSDRSIAAELGLSLPTVKARVRSILHKLHAANRVQAARLAREGGLIDGA